MVNIKTEFLREYTDQAISFGTASTDDAGVRPGPGLKQRDSTGGVPGEADISVTSDKQQASSSKPQAASKPEPVQVQASSAKRQAFQPE